MGHGPGGDMGGRVPPECSEELRNSELQPQQENVTVDGVTGNLIFRTVCSNDPYTTNAISLPSGRAASAFDVEAATSKVAFGIRVEGGSDVYHSSQGKEALHSLLLDDSSPVYTIYLDAAASDPGSRITLKFIDHPK